MLHCAQMCAPWALFKNVTKSLAVFSKALWHKTFNDAGVSHACGKNDRFSPKGFGKVSVSRFPQSGKAHSV